MKGFARGSIRAWLATACVQPDWEAVLEELGRKRNAAPVRNPLTDVSWNDAKECGDRFGVASIGSVVQRGRPVLVCHIRVGAGGHERGDRLSVASQGGIVQRCRPVLLPHGIGIGELALDQVQPSARRESRGAEPWNCSLR